MFQNSPKLRLRLGVFSAAVLVLSMAFGSLIPVATQALSMPAAQDLSKAPIELNNGKLQGQVLGASTVDLRVSAQSQANFSGGFSATPVSVGSNGNWVYTFTWGRTISTRNGFIYVSQLSSTDNLYHIVAEFPNPVPATATSGLSGTGTVTSDPVFTPGQTYRLTYYSYPYGTYTSNYIILRSTFTAADNPTNSVTGACEYPAPPLGCSYQGGDAYPACNAKLVCNNNNSTTTTTSLTPGTFNCSDGYKISSDGTSCVSIITFAMFTITDTSIGSLSGNPGMPVYVVPGQSVLFVNSSNQVHEIIADNGAFDFTLQPHVTLTQPDPNDPSTATEVFTTPGIYTFHDKNNTSLTGKLIVSNGVAGSSDYLQPTSANGYTNYNSATAAASFVPTPTSCTAGFPAQVGHYAIIPNVYISNDPADAQMDLSTLPPGLGPVTSPDPIAAASGGQLVAGIPTKAGTYNVYDTTGDKLLTITIVNNGDDLSGSNTGMPVGQVGVAYPTFTGPIFQSDAKASAGNYWKIVLGNLPAGISFDSTTGKFSGTPTEAGLSQVMIFEYSAAGKILGESEIGILIYSQANHGYGNCVGAPVFGSSSQAVKTGYDLGSYPAGTSVPATYIGTNFENIRNDAGQVAPPYFPGIYQYFISTFASMNNPTINAMINSSYYPGNMEGDMLITSNGLPAGDQGVYNFTIQAALYSQPPSIPGPQPYPPIATATIPFSLTVTAPGTTSTPTAAASQPFAVSCSVLEASADTLDSYALAYNNGSGPAFPEFEEKWEFLTSGRGVVSDPGNPPVPNNSGIKVTWSGDPSVAGHSPAYAQVGQLAAPLLWSYDVGYTGSLSPILSSKGYAYNAAPPCVGYTAYTASGGTCSETEGGITTPTWLWSGSPSYAQGQTVSATVTAVNQFGDVASATCATVLNSDLYHEDVAQNWSSRSTQSYNGHSVLLPGSIDGTVNPPTNFTCPSGYGYVNIGSTTPACVLGVGGPTSSPGAAQATTSNSSSSTKNNTSSSNSSNSSLGSLLGGLGSLLGNSPLNGNYNFNFSNSATGGTSSTAGANACTVPATLSCGGYDPGWGGSLQGTYGTGFYLNSSCQPLSGGSDSSGQGICNLGYSDAADPNGLGIAYYDSLSGNTTCLSHGAAKASQQIFITGHTPTSGPIGTIITVAGVGFSATGNQVVIDNGDAVVPGTITANGQLQFTFPATETCKVVGGGSGSDYNFGCIEMGGPNAANIIPTLGAPYSSIPFPTLSTYYPMSVNSTLSKANTHSYYIKNSLGATSQNYVGTTFMTTALGCSTSTPSH
ncbi:MAG: putative Ig domain-containing protein [Candidatus Doudnabacteria bacterium]|nr:putative Ig domain-containing protein [Candidatus Doudnabacteria bacterium]